MHHASQCCVVEHDCTDKRAYPTISLQCGAPIRGHNPHVRARAGARACCMYGRSIPVPRDLKTTTLTLDALTLTLTQHSLCTLGTPRHSCLSCAAPFQYLPPPPSPAGPLQLPTSCTPALNSYDNLPPSLAPLFLLHPPSMYGPLSSFYTILF